MRLSLPGDSMKRRSRAGGEPVKGRRRKTPEAKRRNVPKVAAHSSLSTTGDETDVARLTRELSEERQKQATDFAAQRLAISEVLRVIASSPHDLQPILQSIIDSATHLLRAEVGIFRLVEGTGFRLGAYKFPGGFHR